MPDKQFQGGKLTGRQPQVEISDKRLSAMKIDCQRSETPAAIRPGVVCPAQHRLYPGHQFARFERFGQGLFENIKSLNAKYQDDKKRSKINEDEMFDEICSLEEQLNQFIELKKSKEEEINQLKTRIKKYERRKSSKSKRNEFDFITKRFAVLYKNVKINRKAIAGLLSLSEDQQIKAEERIFQLDQHPGQITIKRKVFSGKKHKTTCLEVIFSYNGRLYYKKNEKTKVEVLVIGSKNTQLKDMEFLHNT